MIKFKIKQSILQKSLNHMRTVFAKKSPMKEMSHLLIDADKDILKIKATDIEMTILENIQDVKIETSGKTLIPASTFSDIVNALDSSKQISIELNQNQNKITISSEKSEYQLPVLSAAEFPVIDESKLTNTLEVDAKKFLKLTEKVTIAMSNDEVRQYLNGAFLHTFKKDNNCYLCLVATDGHKLAKTHLKLDKECDVNGLIIPKKCVSELQKILQSAEIDKLSISFSDNLIKFSINDITLWSSLIAGEYPDYFKAIPPISESKLVSDTKALLSVIDRVSIVCEKGDPINFKVEKNNIVATCKETISGSYAKEDLDVTATNQVSISFNSGYIRDICSQIDTKKLELFFSDSNQAVLIRGLGNTDCLFVLMPIRL